MIIVTVIFTSLSVNLWYIIQNHVKIIYLKTKPSFHLHETQLVMPYRFTSTLYQLCHRYPGKVLINPGGYHYSVVGVQLSVRGIIVLCHLCKNDQMPVINCLTSLTFWSVSHVISIPFCPKNLFSSCFFKKK